VLKAGLVMVIDKIRLENFKTHKDTTIEFKEITSIIGSNGNGKTNIIKALFLVLYNEDWPDDFIKHGETKSTITIWLTNGNIIKRSRTKSKQEILITYKDGTTKEFTGKNDAQSYIELASGISKIKLKNGDVINLNYSEVRNKTSLLEGSASTLAKRFSYLLQTESAELIKNNTSKELKENIKIQENLLSEINSIVNQSVILEDRVAISNNLFNSYKSIHNKITDIQETLDFIKDKEYVFNKVEYKHNFDFDLIKEKITKLEYLKSIGNPFHSFNYLNLHTLDDYWLLEVSDNLWNSDICEYCGNTIKS
jgi:exonuclease SbcC